MKIDLLELERRIKMGENIKISVDSHYKAKKCINWFVENINKNDITYEEYTEEQGYEFFLPERIIFTNVEWYISDVTSDDEYKFEDIFGYSEWDEITDIFQTAIKKQNISKQKINEIIDKIYSE